MHGRNNIVQTRACSKISLGSLKRSADYNLRLEFLILLSSGQFKLTCDKLTELQRLKNRGKKGRGQDVKKIEQKGNGNSAWSLSKD